MNKYVFLIPIISLFIATSYFYKGHFLNYLIFSILLNSLLFSGFRKDRIFFDTFIGIFFWLGFWLKTSLRVVFNNGIFNDVVGHFSQTEANWDIALNVTSVGILGLLVASFFREKYLFNYFKFSGAAELDSFFNLYKKYRKAVLSIFVLVFIFIAITNLYYGIYQRGTIPRTKLPLGLGGIYSWLILFGFSTITAVFLNFESKLRDNPYLVTGIGLLESFFSNVSLLSRGMILNICSLAYGAYCSNREHFSKKFKIYFILLFCSLFGLSVITVNVYRSYHFFENEVPPITISTAEVSDSKNESVIKSNIEKPSKPFDVNNIDSMVRVKRVVSLTSTLFVDRYVGIEGVMSVSSYRALGFELWKKAWNEKYSDSGTSLYDKEIMQSPYVNELAAKNHFISLPGLLAFCFYPGSYLFLFFAMVLASLVAAGIEYFVFKLSGHNIILCALMGQVIAYRYSNFGYVPGQSYLLIGTILFSIVLIFLFDKFLKLIEKSKLE